MGIGREMKLSTLILYSGIPILRIIDYHGPVIPCQMLKNLQPLMEEALYHLLTRMVPGPTWDISRTNRFPYYIFGDVNIPVGQELIIEPCVHVMFRGDYKFEVFGRLLAEGDTYNQITFAATDTIECWQGLKIVNTNYNGQDSSKLVNCRITFSSADKPGPSNYRQGGAVYLNNSSDVLINNCLLNKNYAANAGGALYLNEVSSPTLINNTFSDNSSPLGGAIFLSYGSPVIHGGIIENNEAESGGACFLTGSNPTFSGVTIRNNNAKFGGGIYMYGGCTPVFDPVNLCNIYMNYAYAAGLDFCAINWWGYPITINVDTFTVINSNSHFVYPEDIYTVNIQNGIIEQTNEDLYVSMTGSDENTGTDPSEPLKTMYMALLKIQADSTDPKTIHLDEGTFSQGATGELLPVNCREYVSLSGKGTDKSFIYGENINQLLFAYDDSGFDIDSLELNGGYAEEGGAIHLENYSSPVLKELKITDNTATGSGGGIFCSSNSSPTIENSLIIYNFCEGNGGGISITTNCNPHFNNIILNHNHALYQGGGLDARVYCNFSMDSSVVHDNTAANGAGMMIFFDSDPVITNTTISFNHGISEVSGYFGEAGGIWISYLSDARLTNVTIEYNEAGHQAGGIYGSSGSNSVFSNVIIRNNHAPKGGGIYLSGNANHKYYNCLIYQNSAYEYSGGGIYMDQSDPIFINTTITDNTANSTWGGGALYARYSDPQLINCILWDNEPDEINGYNENVIAEYSDIMGSYPGTGNIDTDPLFYYDPYVEDYTLVETSPCINAGNPDTTGLNLPLIDLAGNPRISNDIIDMGAYEYQFPGAGIELDITVNADVVDWVLIELRDTTDASLATGETMIARQAVFLLNDGKIVGLDGSNAACCVAAPTITNNLFVVIRHRNHLGIISANPITESGGIYTYDFTTPAGQAHGTNAQKNLGGGVYGIFGGDGNADGTIDTDDKTTIWSVEAGSSGYLKGDFNMNSQTDNSDKNDYWIENNGNSSQIPD
jgi:predicted outer membrane repeat protein